MITLLITCGLGICLGVISYIQAPKEEPLGFTLLVSLAVFLCTWFISFLLCAVVFTQNNIAKDVEAVTYYPIYSQEKMMFFIEDNELKQINQNIKIILSKEIDSPIVEKREYSNFLYPWGYEYFLILPMNQIL